MTDKAIAPTFPKLPNSVYQSGHAALYDATQMHQYALRFVEQAQQRAAQPDCRTCEYMWIDIDLVKSTSKESCARPGGAVCINGNLHKQSPKVVLWRTE